MEPHAQLNGLSQQLHRLQQCLDEDTLDALARQSGFVVRQARKLTGSLAFKLYTLACILPLASFRNCAVLAGLFGEFTLSKQALEQRIGPAARRFLELCLGEVLTRRLHGKPSGDHCLLDSFQRVLILDSTTLALPAKWAALFPGPRNQSQRPGAQLKIQAVLDLCVHRFGGIRHHPLHQQRSTRRPGRRGPGPARGLVVAGPGLLHPRLLQPNRRDRGLLVEPFSPGKRPV